MFMQTSGSTDRGFVLEYQEGSTDEHFQVAAKVELEQVVAAFTAYGQGSDTWRTDFNWSKLAIRGSYGWWHWVGVVVWGAAVAFVAWVLLSD